jgi:RNase P/RNase MRP subunit p30
MPDFRNIDATRELFSSLPFFGIRGCFVICSLDTLPKLKELKPLFPSLALYSRCILQATDVESLKREYKKYGEKFDLISVQTSIPEVLNFAARDPRFQILCLRTRAEWAAFNAGVGSLAFQSSAGVEFPLEFLTKTESGNSIAIRLCRKAINIAYHAHAPLLLSSFAGTKYDLFGAREISFLANTILGIPLGIGKKITSTFPELVLKKNPAHGAREQKPDGVRIIADLQGEDNTR